MDIRALEKTNKIGYIFDIFYNGKYFDSFDEIKNKETVKGCFKNIMNSLGFTWAKGIQQEEEQMLKFPEVIVFMLVVL